VVPRTDKKQNRRRRIEVFKISLDTLGLVFKIADSFRISFTKVVGEKSGA
jgi:hypothetical protein